MLSEELEKLIRESRIFSMNTGHLATTEEVSELLLEWHNQEVKQGYFIGEVFINPKENDPDDIPPAT